MEVPLSAPKAQLSVFWLLQAQQRRDTIIAFYIDLIMSISLWWVGASSSRLQALQAKTLLQVLEVLTCNKPFAQQSVPS